MAKAYGYRPLWIALASVAFTHPSWPASADEAGFPDEANRACRQILDTRPSQVLGKGQKARVEVLAAFLKRTDLSADARRALKGDIAASRDELSRSLRALEKLAPPAGRQDDWAMFIAFLEAEVAQHDNRLEWLENPAGALIPASEFGPPAGLVSEAMGRLGFAGRDCELVARDVDIPEDRRIFVQKTAAACTAIVTRRSRQDHERSRDIAMAAFVDAHRGTLDLPRPELDAALSAMETEWRVSFEELSEIPAEPVPDRESWDRFLQLLQHMAEVQQSRLLVLRRANEDPSAAYKAVQTPIMDVDLSALGLENTDCRSIRF